MPWPPRRDSIPADVGGVAQRLLRQRVCQKSAPFLNYCGFNHFLSLFPLSQLKKPPQSLQHRQEFDAERQKFDALGQISQKCPGLLGRYH